MVYSPLDALRIAKSNPDRTVVFFAIGFETTAPSTALTLKRAKAEGVTNFLCVCNHVTIVPPLRALLDSPDLRLDGFIGPGHVSTVVGVRPFEFIPAEYGKPLVTAGFEPLDVLQTIRMILTQLRKGECKVENQYKRVVPYEGNPAALKVMAEVFELRPHFEWRGLGFISQSALKLSEAYADFDAELRYQVPGVRVADPKACQCGEVLKGVIKPWECKVFGTACTPEHAIGTCMVSPEGACAAYYNYGRYARASKEEPSRCLMTVSLVTSEKRIGAGRPSAPDREQRVQEIIETARAKRPRFKDSTVNMTHGAGGKATQTLIEGLFVPAFESEALAELGDSGVVTIGDTSVAMTTDTFVVKPLRFPGGSIGELAVCGTVNDLAAAGAKAQALSLAFVLEEGLDADVLREEVAAIAGTAAEAGVSVVTGDTKVVERGHADGMYICTTGIGQVDSRATLGPASLKPGDKSCVSKTIGEHGTAIMLARGELGIESDVVSDTRSLWPVADALLDSAGESLRCMRDATRGGVASRSQRARARVGRRSLRARGRRARHPRGRGCLRAPRHRPHVRGERGRHGRLRRSRRRRRRRSRRSAPCPAAKPPSRSPRSPKSPPAWSSSRPPSAAGA